MSAADRLIVPLDVGSLEQARELIDKLDGVVSFYKVGSQLFTASGPSAIEEVKSRDAKVFLDLKFHDIPNTVALACQSAAELGVDILTLHSLGGFEMMESAVKRVWHQEKRPLLFGVTILTSLHEAFLKDVMGATDRNLEEQILHLAKLAQSAGLDGVVSSPLEVSSIKNRCGKEFQVLTPGIRPSGYETHDQARVLTPKEAIAAGADYLVIGRPIIQGEDPRQIAQSILDEMEEGLGED